MATTPADGSAWAPLRSRVFTVFWAATLVANIGTWIREVGAGWLMTSLSASATSVALVQVATSLPIFLLSLPAGALADIVDRRRLLITANLAMAVVTALLGLVTLAGAITPMVLLGGLFVAGACTAVMQPIAQSLTPMTVARTQLRAAVALNSMGFNVARAIGPALGGVLIVVAGVSINFFVAALSHLALILTLLWWKDAGTRISPDPAETLGGAMRAGLRYALHAPALQRILLRSGSFFLFASAYWALLPLIARRELQGGPGYYGVLLGCIGAGAVLGALALPAIRRRIGAEATMRGGITTTIAVLVALGAQRDPLITAAAMLCAGAAWIQVLTTANVAAQTQLPNWVRGRGLAVYLTVFYGAMTLGSLAWGGIADTGSVSAALWLAALLGLLVLVLSFARPMPEHEPDLSPSMHWSEPSIPARTALDAGPVLVTVEYAVDAANRDAFLAELRAFAVQRLRDGAFDWGVYEDVEAPGQFLETFFVGSWLEHLRQHHRVSVDDAQHQRRLHRFHVGAMPPRVMHRLAPPFRD